MFACGALATASPPISVLWRFPPPSYPLCPMLFVFYSSARAVGTSLPFCRYVRRLGIRLLTEWARQWKPHP